MSVPKDQVVYKWKIVTFVAYPSYDNYQNVVFQMFADYIATYIQTIPNPDGGDPFIKEYKADLVGILVNVSTNNITNFVPFDQLTYDTAVSWIDSDPRINIASLQEGLYNSINSQVYPPPPAQVYLPPPFAQ